MKIKFFSFLLIFLYTFNNSLSGQTTDSASYHSTRKLSDTSYSLKKANGDSTIFIFESSINNNANDWSSSKFNLKNLLTYPTQDTAIKYGLVRGDVYKVPPDANNNVLLAIVDNELDTNFNLIIDNSNNDTHLKFRIDGNANFNLTIYWGDGSSDSYTSAQGYTPVHDYTTAGIFKASCQVSSYSSVKRVIIGTDYSDSCNVSAFHNVQLFTNLQVFDVEGTGMKVWSYSEGLPASLNSSWMSGNKLNTAEINKLLIYYDSQQFTPGPKNLFIRYMATPTGAGLNAKASLEAKGWTIHL